MLARGVADQSRILCEDAPVPALAIIGRVKEFMAENVKHHFLSQEQRRYEDEIHGFGAPGSRPAFTDPALRGPASRPAARDLNVRRHLNAQLPKARTNGVGRPAQPCVPSRSSRLGQPSDSAFR
jgi:hypothetical protein